MRALFRILILAVIALGLWLGWALFIPVKPSQTQILLFPTGSSTGRIASELQSHGVINDARAFRLLRYMRPGWKLKAGEYKFDTEANAIQVMRRIVRGDIYAHTVVVPEGYNMFDIASAIESAGLGEKSDFLQIAQHELALVRDFDPAAKSLEGYLFPDTYQFSRTQTMHDIAAAMVHRFQREARAIGLTENMHQTVTLASIVEKETASADERPQVASVYQNRLSKGMALAADPTVVYAALLDGRYRGTIYGDDLRADSPYNTYKFAGLPPGPIANPGRASLEAAMKPAKTNFLFFVAVGDGSGKHRFSTSFEEHSRNVIAYRHTQKH